MPKVTVSLGLTVQLGEDSREFARPYVEIRDIDTGGDLEAQLAEAEGAVLYIQDRVFKLVGDSVVILGGDERLLPLLQELKVLTEQEEKSKLAHD